MRTSGICTVLSLIILAVGQTGCPMAMDDGNSNGNTNSNTNSNANNNSNDNTNGQDNRSPTANAGPNQTVNRGANVQLNGSASNDPDGDTITYSWSQLSGASVTLNNATAAVASFVAPTTGGPLVFRLRVSDGEAASVDDIVITVEVPPATLFVAGFSTVRSYAASNLDGEVDAIAVIEAGAATSLFQPRAIVVTNSGALIVSRQNGGLAIWNDATAIDVDAPADRVVQGSNTKLSAPVCMAYDSDNDRLFVGNPSSNAGVLVFDGVSGAAFDGNVPPTREFSPPDRFPFDTPRLSMTAMVLDDAGNLFVVDNYGTNNSMIHVFADPGLAENDVAPIHTFTSRSWGIIEDMELDQDGTLYIVDESANVFVVTNAMNREGEITPGVIAVNRALAALHGVTLTSGGDAYLADRANHMIYTIRDIASRSGTVSPNAEMEDASANPAFRQMYLVEP